MLRKGFIGAAIAALALGSAAFADDSTKVASQVGTQAQINSKAPVDPASPAINPVYGDDQIPAAPASPAAPVAPAAAPAAPAPAPAAPANEGVIMWGFDKIGVGKFMEDHGFSITGYVDVGYFYDLTVPKNAITSPPRSSPPDFIFFPGDYKNQIMLNQLDLAIQKTVDTSKFDVGFDVEGIFGRDAVYTHSNGILDNVNKRFGTSPDDDLDLEQAYVQVAIPLGNGITITAGKFVTLLGNEVINPTGNALYTHSYIFSYGIPFTQTGITGAYKFCDTLTATAGITRGWNQSTDDNNSAIDFLGQVVWTPTSKLGVTVNFSEGPQSTDDDSDYWTVPEAIVSYQVSDQLKVAADLLYGDASSISQWFGAAGYASYTFDKYATLNFRAEFYHDGRGFTTGVGVTDTNYIEGTLGVAVTPLPDIILANSLTIRPEIRLDSADRGVYDGSKFTQLTAALDAYWKF
ncbi:MAG: outer membrane beta-barrel protein [Tepidisphaeraceae bacterium]